MTALPHEDMELGNGRKLKTTPVFGNMASADIRKDEGRAWDIANSCFNNGVDVIFLRMNITLPGLESTRDPHWAFYFSGDLGIDVGDLQRGLNLLEKGKEREHDYQLIICPKTGAISLRRADMLEEEIFLGSQAPLIKAAIEAAKADS